MNYSKYVANSKNLNYDDYNISFKITGIIIPKFVDRHKQNKTIEELHFDSNF